MLNLKLLLMAATYNLLLGLDSRLLRRAFGGHPAHEQPPSQLLGVEAEPRPPGSRLAPSRDQVAQNAIVYVHLSVG